MARPRGYRTPTTAVSAGATVTLSGPLFQPSADKTLRENIRRMMQGIADEGAAAVAARSPRIRGEAGGFVSGIVGRTRSTDGRRWALSAVVSAFPDYRAASRVYPWREKGARGYTGRSEAVYRGGKLEQRYGMFRSVTSQLRSSRAVMAANLTKGLE